MAGSTPAPRSEGTPKPLGGGGDKPAVGVLRAVPKAAERKLPEPAKRKSSKAGLTPPAPATPPPGLLGEVVAKTARKKQVEEPAKGKRRARPPAESGASLVAELAADKDRAPARSEKPRGAELPADLDFPTPKRSSPPPEPRMGSAELAVAEPPPMPRSMSGKHIGPYPIEEEIGSGGMSVVYRSVQQPLGRPIAIKVLRVEIAAQPHLVERFAREAKSLAALQHENILHILEYRTDGGVPYMVTEYVEGVDLYDILERHGAVDVDVAAVVGAHIARALDYAHTRGVIHRDVKPANIMFTAEGGLKLMDFGIARQTAMVDLTQAGSGVGTPAYMSPEQILCERLDGRTDIWSLGVVLYQMVTGRKPFIQDEERTVLHKIRVEKPELPRTIAPHIPRALERIILRCLEKRPQDRYPVAQQLAMALERFVAARVAMGHSALLLHYLKTIGELTEEQVEAAMPAGFDGGSRLAMPQPSRRHSDRPPLGIPWAGWVGIISGVLFLTLLVVVLATWPSRGEGTASGAGEASAGGSSLPRTIFVRAVGGGSAVPTSAGGLRVVAHPWADVYLGGKRVETTPFDQPVPVPAGTHRLVLQHPRFGKHTRTIKIKPGEVLTVSVDLAGGREPPAAPAGRGAPAPRTKPAATKPPATKPGATKPPPRPAATRAPPARTPPAMGAASGKGGPR